MSAPEDIATLSPSLNKDAALADVLERMADELKGQGRVEVEAWQAKYPQFASELVRLVPTLDLLVDFSSAGGDRSAAEQHDSFPGKTLGDFRIVRELGRGGMGIVYEAEQLSLNRRVALKILPTAAVLDPRTLQRFKNEAQAAAALDHPHIVDVYGIGAERGVHYYAMRLIDGCTLAELVENLRGVAEGSGEQSKVQGPKSNVELEGETRPVAGLSTFTTQESLRSARYFRSIAELGVRVADGLEHAHQQGVIHRDIKPSNLMLDSQGKVWITDFGLAHIEANQTLTVTGDLLGTLRYMSPEQALANRVPVDQRTDIYSLGATLYELVALTPVFGESDRATLIHKIALSEPIPPRKLNQRIPADLETILLKMLEKDPGSRYGSARELADDLTRFVEQQPIHARRRSWSQHIAKWSARNRPLVAALAGMLLVLATVVAGMLGWQARDAAARQAQVETAAIGALDRAARLEEQDEWAAAQIEIKQAEAALAGSEHVKPELRDRLQAHLSNAELVLRLEEIRILAATTFGGDFDFLLADDAYTKAFAKHGIDLSQLSRRDAVIFAQQSPIREELAAALTNWSIVRKRAANASRPSWRELMAMAKEVDPDKWRNRLRQAFEPPGIPRDELTELVLNAPLETLPPTTLFLIVQAAGNQRVSSEDVQLRLRDVQRRHADDFWINFALARFFQQAEPSSHDDAVRYYAAAAALRPRTAAVHSNLGAALHRQGKRQEAMAEYRRAIEVEPGFAAAYSNLGEALNEEEKYQEAADVLQQGLAIRDDWAEMHRNLAVALAGQGHLDDAIAAYRQALELKPNYQAAKRELADCLNRQVPARFRLNQLFQAMAAEYENLEGAA